MALADPASNRSTGGAAIGEVEAREGQADIVALDAMEVDLELRRKDRHVAHGLRAAAARARSMGGDLMQSAMLCAAQCGAQHGTRAARARSSWALGGVLAGVLAGVLLGARVSLEGAGGRRRACERARAQSRVQMRGALEKCAKRCHFWERLARRGNRSPGVVTARGWGGHVADPCRSAPYKEERADRQKRRRGR